MKKIFKPALFLFFLGIHSLGISSNRYNELDKIDTKLITQCKTDFFNKFVPANIELSSIEFHHIKVYKNSFFFNDYKYNVEFDVHYKDKELSNLNPNNEKFENTSIKTQENDFNKKNIKCLISNDSNLYKTLSIKEKILEKNIYKQHYLNHIDNIYNGD